MEQEAKMRYIKILFDDDGKAHQHLLEKQVYGTKVIIKKEECLNHVAKRLGIALRNKVQEWNSWKVTLGGGEKSSFKEETIKLASYYRKAIKDNAPKMKAAIFASLHHCMSTDSKPQHMHCPTGRFMVFLPKVAESSPSLQDKVERAKALVEAQRLKKAQEEREKEKQEEIKRRNMGKSIQQAEQIKQEKEMQEWAKSRAKDKEVDRLAREKVKAMIALDRVESTQPYKHTKEAEQAEKERAARSREEAERSMRNAAMNSNDAHLQFRMPDGSYTTHCFTSDASLAEARRFVIEEIKPSFKNFTLSTTYPRIEFNESNYSQSLMDLQLAPSAVLLILPGSKTFYVKGGLSCKRKVAVPLKQGLRPVVIDGNNVARRHGLLHIGPKRVETFSCKAIKVSVQYFAERGHEVMVIIPRSRLTTKHHPKVPTTNKELLDDLNREGYVVDTPDISYDDGFVLKLAAEKQAAVLSNDKYRDFLKKPEYKNNAIYRRIIESRLMTFTFAGDILLLADDPYGRNRPRLEEILSL